MIQPETYYGYDEQGNQICSSTAVDATKYINPENIREAIQNINTVTEEETGKIVKALNDIIPELEKALVVDGEIILKKTLEDIVAYVQNIPSSLEKQISEINTLANKKHTELQEQANEAAKEAIENQAGVKRVS